MQHNNRKVLRLGLAMLALSCALLTFGPPQAKGGGMSTALDCCNDIGCCKNGTDTCASYTVGGAVVFCLGPRS
jgi:hypothetical protein